MAIFQADFGMEEVLYSKFSKPQKKVVVYGRVSLPKPLILDKQKASGRWDHGEKE
ncbi:hypothetical protein COLO4_25888 [Corchorus olitorius]|uniref:Uncharacterized protein n=1 Tax=Corchorus olitorius TaxID=93759 RepID=A0A1R3HZK0_9ROSI|nr:hypothetical protein COLO4_25888 [Corchorus olitorius]